MASTGTIQDVIALEETCLGDPYVYGGTSLHATDCSGLQYYSFLSAGGINIGRGTAEQWSSPLGQTIVDASAGQTFQFSDLQPGDLIFYGAPGAPDGGDSHVVMYIGNNQIIQDPYTGASVEENTLGADFPMPPAAIDASEPFLGVRRFSQSLNSSGAATSFQSTSSTQQTASQAIASSVITNLADADLSDPRSNLPFSVYFQDQTYTAGIKNLGHANNWYNPESASIQMVRGGISEINPTRPGGPFQFFFMMNPTSIDTNYSIAVTTVAPMTALAPGTFSGAPIQYINISWQVIFNRTYEVYMGNVPGPSQIGVRWDVRAFERLLGLYDGVSNNTNPNGAYTGDGTYSPTSANANTGQTSTDYPMAVPVQVAFGGVNSYQFQAYMNSVDYQYTMFSDQMIPIECYMTLSCTRVYVPSATEDIANNLVNANPYNATPTSVLTPSSQKPASGSVTGGPAVSSSGY